MNAHSTPRTSGNPKRKAEAAAIFGAPPAGPLTLKRKLGGRIEFSASSADLSDIDDTGERADEIVTVPDEPDVQRTANRHDPVDPERPAAV